MATKRESVSSFCSSERAASASPTVTTRPLCGFSNTSAMSVSQASRVGRPPSAGSLIQPRQ
nr:hypothetical protein [Methylorubrum aminovorans]